jgi:hypothetical protein
MKPGGIPTKTGYLIFMVQRVEMGGSRRGNGAEDRSRTDDLLITNQLLYQLSYFGLMLYRLYRCARRR